MRDQVKPSFVIFDVRALCESALKVSEIMQLSLACLLKRICVRDGNHNKKAVLPQGNRAMPQVFFSVEVRQQHSLQV